MRFLAEYVTRSLLHGILAALVLSLLGFVIAPLGILSGAVVALVTLRSGPKEGAITGLVVALVSGLSASMIFAVPAWSVALALVGWIPLWSLALLLRFSRSLGLAVSAGVAFGGLLLLGMYLLQPDQAGFWRVLIEPFVKAMTENNPELLAQQGELLDTLSIVAAGGFAAGFYLQLVITLFLGRWWQSLLFNPGGFRQEFHALRMHRLIVWSALLCLVLAQLLSGRPAEIAGNLMMVLAVALILQGLAVVHGIVAARKANIVWLVMTYVILILAAELMAVLLMLVGLVDQFVDFRSRVAKDVS